MVVDQAGIDVIVVEDAMPEIDGIDAETDRADAALALEFRDGVQPFAEGPLRVLPPLVLDIVDVNDVEVCDAQPRGALVQRGPNPPRE